MFLKLFFFNINPKGDTQKMPFSTDFFEILFNHKYLILKRLDIWAEYTLLFFLEPGKFDLRLGLFLFS